MYICHIYDIMYTLLGSLEQSSYRLYRALKLLLLLVIIIYSFTLQIKHLV